MAFRPFANLRRLHFRAAASPQPSVRIAALLPPTCPGAGYETITLRNKATTTVGLDGWKLRKLGNQEIALHGNIDPKGSLHFAPPASVVPLNDGGDTVCLLAPEGSEQFCVTFDRNDVSAGVEVTFD